MCAQEAKTDYHTDIHNEQIVATLNKLVNAGALTQEEADKCLNPPPVSGFDRVDIQEYKDQTDTIMTWALNNTNPNALVDPALFVQIGRMVELIYKLLTGKEATQVDLMKDAQAWMDAVTTVTVLFAIGVRIGEDRGKKEENGS